MNCYVGMAKLIVKSCFQVVKPKQEIPVPQLQPLDAKNIIRRQVKDSSTSKECFALSDAHERLFKPKPISDEEAWALTVAWAEAKAQERETKEASYTDTDESYDSDDFEVGVSIQPVERRLKSVLFAGSDTYEDEDNDDDNIDKFARAIWDQIASMIAIWGAKERAATMIQAAARGRAVRLVAWFAALDAALLMRVRVRKERRRAAKEARREWNAALNPITWYRV
jgi:hypothetical protein